MTMTNMTRRLGKLEAGVAGVYPGVQVVFTHDDEPAPMPVLERNQKLIVVRFVRAAHKAAEFQTN